MFNVKDKIMVVDQSQFRLGAKVVVTQEGTILLHTTIEDMSNLEEQVINIAEGLDIKNIFIKALAVEDQDKILDKYTKTFDTNFSKKIDKIYFHMI